MISKEGFDFSFNENACASCGGKCCTGDGGYVFINPDESKAIREHLGLDEEEFTKHFLKKVGFRYSFKEVPFEDGFACVFFDKEKRNCQIYDLRPKQCRTFPFWEYFKTHIEEVKKECPGIS